MQELLVLFFGNGVPAVLSAVIVLAVGVHHGGALRVVLGEFDGGAVHFDELVFDVVVGVPFLIVGHFEDEVVFGFVDFIEIWSQR